VIVTHDGIIEPRDELQARVIERLRAARGAPVSFDELRTMGIENPALLGYELAAAGLPIEQAREPGGGALTLDANAPLRDDDAHPDDASVPGAGASPAVAHGLPRVSSLRLPSSLRLLSSGLRPSRTRMGASVGLTSVLAAVLVLALSDHHNRTARLSADHPPAHAPRAHSPSTKHSAPLAASTPTPEVKRAATPVPAQRAASVAVSPAVAASLEAEGHEMLVQGQYAQAIGALRGAIAASGGSLARCAEPTSEACLTYAYALYDLGSALRLDGRPDAAIPVLSERLQINNQRPTVQAQLELARAGVA
jgi:hypothetical protein